MSERFVAFLLLSRWASAVMALVYHVRFLQFVGYDGVHAKTSLSKAFYFLTGLGHESFAVFFIIDGIVAGLILLRRRARDAGSGAADGVAISRHLASLYLILLPALILGASFDAAGLQFFNHAGVYTDFPKFSTLTLTYSSLVGNVLMLQPFVVPTFGSNGMLYLLSYLFWCFILFLLFVRASGLGTRRGRFLQVLLLAIVLILMPVQFLSWAAIWLMGVAVVAFGESGRLRPPLFLAAAGFIGALVLSRLVGSDTGLLPQPFGEGLVRYKYLLVGIGFAAIARALYPAAPSRNERLLSSVTGIQDGKAGRIASLTFFCHFPVLMLLVAAGSALLEQPLMQQPTPETYGEFVLVVALCVGTTVLLARAVAAVIGAKPVRSTR